MGRSLIERRLRDVTERAKSVRVEISVAAEQLAHFADEAEDARLRALVSETPLAEQAHYEAQRQADTMRRYYEDLLEQLKLLEQNQDELLDRLVAAT
ncbi:MAG: hypothetical protein KDA95_07655 [Acidimicrobiales bacterium]|nr:hypothetical protein [Acidimicrobiales bacterium]